MKITQLLIASLTAVICATVPAWAVTNPSTGDNSIVTIIVGVMAAAAVGLTVVLLLTRNKKQ